MGLGPSNLLDREGYGSLGKGSLRNWDCQLHLEQRLFFKACPPWNKHMAEKELAASLFSKLVQMLAAIHEPIEDIISVWEKWLRITSQKFDKEKKSWEFVWMADIRHPGTPLIGIGLEVVLKGDTVDGRNGKHRIIYKVLYTPCGAGVLPSTVSWKFDLTMRRAEQWLMAESPRVDVGEFGIFWIQLCWCWFWLPIGSMGLVYVPTCGWFLR